MRGSTSTATVSLCLATLLSVAFGPSASAASRAPSTPVRPSAPSVQQAELTASDGAAGDSFGGSLSVSRGTAVVGAPGQNNQTGAAYVFVRSHEKWSQQAKLTASDGASNDAFGDSVAISGDTAVVGAEGWSSATGAAYVFVRSGDTWTQQAKLTAPRGAPFDGFGISVAISDSTVVVGDYQKDAGTGAAYVFTRSSDRWSRQAKLAASDGAKNNSFGYAVAISGSTAVVGAFARNSFIGAAYVFVRSNAVWSQQAELTASDGASDDYFGGSVAVSGSTALVGALNKNDLTGAAYVFVRSGTTWSQQRKLTASDGVSGDNFGTSVALSGDTAVVGASSKNSYAGVAYVFVRSAATWSQQAELTASDGASFDGFGSTAAVYGTTAVVGAPYKGFDTGAAYVFVGLGSPTRGGSTAGRAPTA